MKEKGRSRPPVLEQLEQLSSVPAPESTSARRSPVPPPHTVSMRARQRGTRTSCTSAVPLRVRETGNGKRETGNRKPVARSRDGGAPAIQSDDRSNARTRASSMSLSSAGVSRRAGRARRCATCAVGGERNGASAVNSVSLSHALAGNTYFFALRAAAAVSSATGACIHTSAHTRVPWRAVCPGSPTTIFCGAPPRTDSFYLLPGTVVGGQVILAGRLQTDTTLQIL